METTFELKQNFFNAGKMFMIMLSSWQEYMKFPQPQTDRQVSNKDPTIASIYGPLYL